MLPALAAIPQGHKYCTSTSFSSLKLLNKVFMAVKSVSEFISPCKVATGCPFSIQHYSTIIPAPRKPELVRNGASSTCFTHTARSHPRDVFLVFGMFLRTAVCKDWDGSICPVFLVTIQSYLLSAMLFHQGSPWRNPQVGVVQKHRCARGVLNRWMTRALEVPWANGQLDKWYKCADALCKPQPIQPLYKPSSGFDSTWSWLYNPRPHMDPGTTSAFSNRAPRKQKGPSDETRMNLTYSTC